jgi:hypothetical protein
MKTLKFAIILLIIVSSFSFTNRVKAQELSVNFSLFQRELGPHGRWMTNPRFGQVWIYNDPGFKPYYSDGHWEYTNYGWSWVSDFDWGWAPFHYGRWEYDPSFGWMWIPGYDWGAAWVSWSSYDDYYGWAPLGYGVNINVSFGSIPYDRWTFIPRRNICDRDINRYYIPAGRNNGFRNAVVINNYYEGGRGNGRFMRGPERREVERYTHNNIQERRIDDRERRGRFVAGNNNGRRDQNNNDGGRRNNGSQPVDNNRQRENQNFPRRNEVAANDNNNGDRRNDRRQRTIDAPQRNENLPGRRETNPNNDRQPNRDMNNDAGQGQNRFPGRRDDNRGNRNNDQQHNFPQQRQQPQMERPVRQQPAVEQPQRSFERRADQNTGQGQQRGNSGQGQNGNGNGGGNGRGRRG